MKRGVPLALVKLYAAVLTLVGTMVKEELTAPMSNVVMNPVSAAALCSLPSNCIVVPPPSICIPSPCTLTRHNKSMEK